jgi:hypothetical protein
MAGAKPAMELDETNSGAALGISYPFGGHMKGQLSAAAVVLGAAAVMLTLPVASAAQELTGAQLADFCKSLPTNTSNPADDWQSLTCISFIYGFTAAHQMVLVFQSDTKHPEEFKPLYCAPKDTSEDDYETIFKAYAIANPGQLSQPAENNLFAAFSLAFPCPWLMQRMKEPR